MPQSDIGLIGLAVMGQNLVLNMERNGYAVTVYNRSRERTDGFIGGEAQGKRIYPAYSLEELVASLKKPRVVMLMVMAGAPVDAVLEQLAPMLDKGDVVIDGGNSFFMDTIRRCETYEAMGLLYVGTGVSGGEEGALNGPSIMPGGSLAGYKAVEPILTAISAHVGGEPCCAYLGKGGAGHFIKTTHNGIEYGDMQLIAESVGIMRGVMGMSAKECGAVFGEWNKGVLDSYLIEITARIMGRVDAETGKPLVDMILDSAGQKGTGKWTSQQALDLGSPAPTVAEAVFARYLSARVDERALGERLLKGPDASAVQGDDLLSDLRDALYAAKICSYAQGFDIMKRAGEAYGWEPDFGTIALLWRGGCIIRARFLGDIRAAYERDPNLANLMFDPFFADALGSAQAGLRRIVALCAQTGIAAPSFFSALSYYDAMRAARGTAYVLQAQRDYFGAHTYKRTDRPGDFHTEWLDGE